MSCTSHRDLMPLHRDPSTAVVPTTMNRADTWPCIFSRPLPVPRATDRDTSLENTLRATCSKNRQGNTISHVRCSFFLSFLFFSFLLPSFSLFVTRSAWNIACNIFTRCNLHDDNVMIYDDEFQNGRSVTRILKCCNMCRV